MEGRKNSKVKTTKVKNGNGISFDFKILTFDFVISPNPRLDKRNFYQIYYTILRKNITFERFGTIISYICITEFCRE